MLTTLVPVADGSDPNVLAIGGLVAGIIVLAEVIKVLIAKYIRPGSNGYGELSKLLAKQTQLLEQIGRECHDMHKIHAKTDEDGVPLVYMRRSLESIVKELGTAINNLNTLLDRLVREQRGMAREIDGIKDDVHELLLRARGEATNPGARPPTG